MVLLAVGVEPTQTVAVALVAFGSALMALGILLPRLVGTVRLSAQGLEAQVVSIVEAEAEARGFSETTTKKAVEIATSETTDGLHAWLADLLAEAVREAPGPLASLDLDALKSAMRDPLVRALLIDAGRQRPETSQHDD